MEQDQFKVSVSLGNKILLGVLLLLVIVIGFLAFAFRKIITDDKIDYIYLVQGKDTTFAQTEFNHIAGKTTDTLSQSISIGFASGSKPSQRDKDNLQNIIQNQSEVIALHLANLNPKDEKLEIIYKVKRKEDAHAQEVKIDELELTEEWWKTGSKQVVETGIGFFNVSTLGQIPILAVAALDREKKVEGKHQVAIGFVPLDKFLKDLKGTDLTIATASGYILYDTKPEDLFSRRNIKDEPLFKEVLSNRGKGPNLFATRFDGENGENYLGSYYYADYGVVVLTRIPWGEAIKSTYELLATALVLAGIALGIGIAIAIFFAKSLTAPLKSLHSATKAVAGGDFDLVVKVNSRDELGALSSSFNMMARKISELIEESMEKVRMEGEMAIASTVQQTLIPPNQFKDKNIFIQSHYQSASECGGDWWGFFAVKNRVAMFIADATGHGLPSALITASARSCFSVMHKIAQENPDFSLSPGGMLAYANRVVHDAAAGQIMMTFFASVLDFDTGKLTYASAGHNPPWLFQNDGGGKYRMTSLTAKGQRLGESKDVGPYEEKTVDINPRDILFLYTDGILEGTNPDGQMYGKKQMRKVISSNVSGGPELVIKTLVKDFMGHNQEKPLDDDITMACAMILPNEGHA